MWKFVVVLLLSVVGMISGVMVRLVMVMLGFLGFYGGVVLFWYLYMGVWMDVGVWCVLRLVCVWLVYVVLYVECY